MRNLLALIGITVSIGDLCLPLAARADEASLLYYEFTLNLKGSQLDNLSLGADPELDRLVTEEYELELDLEYSLSERSYLFLNASLYADRDTVKPIDERDSESGIARNQMGYARAFGEEQNFEAKAGRLEFVSSGEHWVWWDEDLDAISLEAQLGGFTGFLAIAEEVAPETTAYDYIDPVQKDVRRIMASLRWQFTDEQALILYYLDHTDNSSSYTNGESVDIDRIDETDADLSWSGISYLADFEGDTLGELQIELNYAQVRGHQTVYEFDDPEHGRAEVDGIDKQRVSGNAQSYYLQWTPAPIDDWTFVIGAARGSGDNDDADGRDESFRQTGLQGDSEVFGELYQPELSNMLVRTYGVVWYPRPNLEIALLGYDYEQVHASEDVRDVSIELDPNGIDRDLGREIDLVFTLQALDGLELILVAAEFEAGSAYGSREGERSHYISIELDYSF
jgi:alginate production protein